MVAARAATQRPQCMTLCGGARFHPLPRSWPPLSQGQTPKHGPLTFLPDWRRLGSPGAPHLLLPLTLLLTQPWLAYPMAPRPQTLHLSPFHCLDAHPNPPGPRAQPAPVPHLPWPACTLQQATPSALLLTAGPPSSESLASPAALPPAPSRPVLSRSPASPHSPPDWWPLPLVPCNLLSTHRLPKCDIPGRKSGLRLPLLLKWSHHPFTC